MKSNQFLCHLQMNQIPLSGLATHQGTAVLKRPRWVLCSSRRSDGVPFSGCLTYNQSFCSWIVTLNWLKTMACYSNGSRDPFSSFLRPKIDFVLSPLKYKL